MRGRSIMKWVLAFLAVFFLSCSTQKNPNNPSYFQMNGAGIFAKVLQAPGVTIAVANIVDSNLAPITNASVTLSYYGGLVPIIYGNNGTTTSTETVIYNGGSTVLTCAVYET